MVIHKIKRVGSSYYSAVVTHSESKYERTEGEEWINFLGLDSLSKQRYIRLRVERINSALQYADVRIMSTFDPVCILDVYSVKSFSYLKINSKIKNFQDACNVEEVDVKLTNEVPASNIDHICVPKSANYNKKQLFEIQEARHRLKIH